MKTTITSAIIEQKTNTCYVTYSTGTEKMYPADKLPKTVVTWLEEHKSVEETQPAVEPVVVEAKPVKTRTKLAKNLPSAKEPVKVINISQVLTRRTRVPQKQLLAVPPQKITIESDTAAKTADMMKKEAVEELAFIGYLAFKVLSFVAEATFWASCLLIQSISKSLIAWLTIALPELGRALLGIGCWAYMTVRDDLPGWIRDTAKPNVVRAYKAAAAGAVRAYREGVVALEIIGLYVRIMISKAVLDEYDATLWTANEQRAWR